MTKLGDNMPSRIDSNGGLRLSGGRFVWLRRWIIRLLILGAVSVLLGALTLGVVLFYFSRDLPDFDSLADYKPSEVTRVFDRNGIPVAEFFEEKRTVVSLAKIPVHVRQAFLAAEDAEFYHHKGMDLPGLIRAFWANLMAGRVVQGGSTITQQVIKTFILGPERSYARKIRELLLALRLENNLTKDEILSLYLNQIYFGHGCYGIQEASLYFFGKGVEKLGLAEGAVLASLPKSPARYSPVRHLERVRKRRDWVLGQMARNSMIDEATKDEACQEKPSIFGQSLDFAEQAPYYAEHVRRLLEDRLGRERVLRGGLRVDLALDLKAQRAAQHAMKEGLRWVDRKQGFRGPVGSLSAEQMAAERTRLAEHLGPDELWSWSGREVEEEGKKRRIWRAEAVKPMAGERFLLPVAGIEGEGKKAFAEIDLGRGFARLEIKGASWARPFSPTRRSPTPKSMTELLKPGDLVEIRMESKVAGVWKVSLSQPPLVQGSLVAFDVESRQVLAMVGGENFRESSLIRAIQSRRQPGSAFKPLLYAAAIASRKFTPSSVVMDTPEVYRNSLKGRAWKPRNFERVFLGPVSLRFALAHSVNTVAVKLAADLGPDEVIRTAKALGIGSKMKRNFSLALGTSEVTLLELTNAYASIASLGTWRSPVFVTRIRDVKGIDLPWPGQESKRAISPGVAYVVTSLLKSVIEEGTGKRALRLGRPLAGKTGTANQQRDGWFVGYSADVACGVWVGFDDHARMGTGWAQGAGTALPIWTDFMERAHENRPSRGFPVPEDVVFVRVDKRNGLLAPPQMMEAGFEIFVEGTEPRSMSARSEIDMDGADSDEGSGFNQEIGRLPGGMFE